MKLLVLNLYHYSQINRGVVLGFKYVLPENCPECLNKKYDIIEEEIVVYRVSKSKDCINNEHKPLVFDRKHSCYKNICKEPIKDKIKCCKCHGLSVQKTKEEIIKKRSFYKRLGKYIFCGKITKEMGKLYFTKSRQSPKHCTFYIFKNKNERDIFEFLEEL